MFEISSEMNWKVREKRAKFRLSLSEASEEIGISRQTLRHIENEKQKFVRKTVFVKLTDWLMKS